MLPFSMRIRSYCPVSRVAPSAIAVGVVALACLASRPVSAQTIFSAGYSLPESLSQAPGSFGAYGGDYFIPDPITNFGPGPKISVVSPAGGPPSVFASTGDYHALGGVFLPTGWNDLSGDYLTTGRNSANTLAEVFAYNSAGAATEVASKGGGSYASAAIAPAGFGAIGGKVVIADQNTGLDILSSDRSLSPFMNSPALNPFGLAFTPTGFGGVGEELLVSTVSGNTINAVNSSGVVSTFATLPLAPGQTGLRQMAFAPAGFIPGDNQPLLFVSVSGSTAGGGTLGDVYAVNGQGNVVYKLRSNLGLTEFDPRGLLFKDSKNLLVSDASDPLVLLPASAFVSTAPAAPEPSALADCAVVALVAAGLMLTARKRRRA